MSCPRLLTTRRHSHSLCHRLPPILLPISLASQVEQDVAEASDTQVLLHTAGGHLREFRAGTRRAVGRFAGCTSRSALSLLPFLAFFSDVFDRAFQMRNSRSVPAAQREGFCDFRMRKKAASPEVSTLRSLLSRIAEQPEESRAQLLILIHPPRGRRDLIPIPGPSSGDCAWTMQGSIPRCGVFEAESLVCRMMWICRSRSAATLRLSLSLTRRRDTQRYAE